MNAAILLYHRIAEPAADPWGLCVPPQVFREQLAVIRQVAQPISVAQMVLDLERGTLASGSVAVTFDDGYADNLHNALPLLDRYQVPATFFVATGHLPAGGEFWWDELEHLLLGPHTLPPILRLGHCAAERTWDLGDAAFWSGQWWTPYAEWRGWQPPPTPRHAAYMDCWQMLRAAGDAERRSMIDQLRSWSGKITAAGTSQTMNADELCRLAASPWAEIGAHTVSHPMLASLPLADQITEIARSRAHITKAVGTVPRFFSYPFGADGTFTAGSVAAVRAAEFAAAFATTPRAVQADADPFSLPRLQVEAWDRNTFAQQLEFWLGGSSGGAPNGDAALHSSNGVATA